MYTIFLSLPIGFSLVHESIGRTVACGELESAIGFRVIPHRLAQRFVGWVQFPMENSLDQILVGPMLAKGGTYS